MPIGLELLVCISLHVADHANTLTLHHLKNYNMKWGIPIAPEAIKETLSFMVISTQTLMLERYY